MTEETSRARLVRTDRYSRLAAKALFTFLCLLAIYQVAIYGLSNRKLEAGDAAGALGYGLVSPKAATAEANAALYGGQTGEAKRLGLAAATAAPARSDAFTVLALVAQQEGDVRAAYEMMARIGLMGWRDAGAQLWLLRSALLRNDPATAVLRADALLRQKLHEDEVTSTLRLIAAEPRGARLVADQLAAEPQWRHKFLQDVKTLDGNQLVAHERILQHLRKTVAPPAQVEIKRYLVRLVADGRYKHAFKLWKSWRTGAGDELELVTLPRDSASPFDWTYRSLPSLSISPVSGEEPQSRPALRISADFTVFGSALEKIAVLPSGSYELRSRSKEAIDGSNRSFHWRVTCAVGHKDLTSTVDQVGTAAQSVTSALRFRVPPSCPAQRLELWVDHQGLSGASLLLEKVEVLPRA